MQKRIIISVIVIAVLFTIAMPFLTSTTTANAEELELSYVYPPSQWINYYYAQYTNAFRVVNVGENTFGRFRFNTTSTFSHSCNREVLRGWSSSESIVISFDVKADTADVDNIIIRLYYDGRWLTKQTSYRYSLSDYDVSTTEWTRVTLEMPFARIDNYFISGDVFSEPLITPTSYLNLDIGFNYIRTDETFTTIEIDNISITRGNSQNFELGRNYDFETGVFASTYENGYNNGYIVGQQDGYDEGYTAGQTAGYNDGYAVGYDTANAIGFSYVDIQSIKCTVYYSSLFVIKSKTFSVTDYNNPLMLHFYATDTNNNGEYAIPGTSNAGLDITNVTFDITFNGEQPLESNRFDLSWNINKYANPSSLDLSFYFDNTELLTALDDINTGTAGEVTYTGMNSDKYDRIIIESRGNYFQLNNTTPINTMYLTIVPIGGAGFSQSYVDYKEQQGFDNGVIYADGRVNVDSASYSAGTVAGVSASTPVEGAKTVFGIVLDILNIPLFAPWFSLGTLLALVVVMGIVMFVVRVSRGK